MQELVGQDTKGHLAWHALQQYRSTIAHTLTNSMPAGGQAGRRARGRAGGRRERPNDARMDGRTDGQTFRMQIALTLRSVLTPSAAFMLHVTPSGACECVLWRLLHFFCMPLRSSSRMGKSKPNIGGLSPCDAKKLVTYFTFIPSHSSPFKQDFFCAEHNVARCRAAC